MPLQNRVDPFGNIFRTTARGTMMGNRGGELHDGCREIVRAYKNRRWITCVLEFRGRHRTVMSPGRYTELFFLDEAVALAAGHRPCAECRRASFNAFKEAWRRGANQARAAFADEIDLELHRARIDARKNKVTYQAKSDSLPDGPFVKVDGGAYLVWRDSLILWSPAGYAHRESRPKHATLTVLTPRPMVECFRQGYRPAVHDSVHDFR